MNYDRMPEKGSSIYLNDCGCERLWDELQADEEAAQQRAGRERKAESCGEPTSTREGQKHHHDCDFESWPLAMAYVPMQPWEEPFDFAKGLRAGTIFPSLRLPFRGGGC